jgi:TonB family protein
MSHHKLRRLKSHSAAGTRLATCSLFSALALFLGLSALAQQAIQEAAPAETAPAGSAHQATPGQPATVQATASTEATDGVTEDELRKLLVGKDLFLRGGFLGDSISFNEHGGLFGHSPYGSYTLCGVRIDRVHLTKHKVELVGARYGLHFLGAMPYEDPAAALDRVKITPKKKSLKITIDRELVIKPKKVKEPKQAKSTANAKPGAAPSVVASAPSEPTEAEQVKAEVTAAPEAERPADWASVTTTTSPAHAKKVLIDALDHIFASGLDERMMSAMPRFWRLYYQAAEAKTDYRPTDSAVMRQTTVDEKAKLLTKFEPGSNEFAQSAGVAGMALYHVVIGADGKTQEIAVARPIGFGLDENAVDSIKKASFSPAVKDGKPVPVLLDLVVQFRIYSKRTAVSSGTEAAAKPTGPVLPGPYSVTQQ